VGERKHRLRKRKKGRIKRGGRGYVQPNYRGPGKRERSHSPQKPFVSHPPRLGEKEVRNEKGESRVPGPQNTNRPRSFSQNTESRQWKGVNQLATSKSEGGPGYVLTTAEKKEKGPRDVGRWCLGGLESETQ